MSTDQQSLTKKEQREVARREKEQKRQQQEHSATKKKFFIGAGVAVATIVLVVLIAQSNKSINEVTNLSPDPGKGPEDAPVLITEYADFECPACAATAPVIKSILEKYGDLVRYEYNDFPLPQHKNAPAAAIGAQCAFAQDKFFEYHDVLYENQAVWESSSMSEDEALDVFTSYAQEIGLDMTLFDTCTTSEQTAERVQEDVSEARALGVRSTPTFYVNDKLISSVPFSQSLTEEIERILQEKGIAPPSTESTSDTSQE